MFKKQLNLTVKMYTEFMLLDFSILYYNLVKYEFGEIFPPRQVLWYMATPAHSSVGVAASQLLMQQVMVLIQEDNTAYGPGQPLLHQTSVTRTAGLQERK